MTRMAPPGTTGRSRRPSRGAAGDPVGEGPTADAATFADLFRAIYLTYHRRDGPRSGLTGASRAVLGHLAHTGPLTIGEAALHLDRAQSVVSEIVDGLERRGLLMRDRDPRTDAGPRLARTGRDRSPSAATPRCCREDALAAAIMRMTDSDRSALLTSAAALLDAAPSTREEPR